MLFIKYIYENYFKKAERTGLSMSGKKMISSEIKRFNRSNIYQQFLCHEALTKQNLVSNLQLCLPTVAKNIDELVADGLVRESGSQGHT